MSFDPYAQWLQIPSDRRPPTLYDLLGLPALESDIERIRAATLERTALVRRYQLSDKAEAVHQLLGELSRAFDCLTDPTRKQAYDEQLRGKAVADTALRAAPLKLTGRPSASPRRRRRSYAPFVAIAAVGACLSGIIFLASRTAPVPQSQAKQAKARPQKSKDVQLPVNLPLPPEESRSRKSMTAAADYGRQRFVGELNALGLNVRYLQQHGSVPAGVDSHLYRVDRSLVQTIEYRTAEAAGQAAGIWQQAAGGSAASNEPLSEAAAAIISPTLGSMTTLFRKEQLLVLCSGADAGMRQQLAKCLGSAGADCNLKWPSSENPAAKVDMEAGLLGKFLPEPKQMGRPGSETRTNIMNQRAGTLAAWIRPERSPPVRYIESVIDADRPLESGSGWGLCGGFVKVILDNEFWATGVPVQLDEWQHIALTFDDQQARVYVDGRLAATHAYRQGHVSSQRYVIGRSAANPLWFQGLLADVRIYDRVLAPQVIEALAAAKPSPP